MIKTQTDRPPCDPLHDEVLAGLQVFHNIFVQSGVGLNEALDDFVKVKGGEVHHIKNPREAHVCISCVTASTSGSSSMVVSSGLKTAL